MGFKDEQMNNLILKPQQDMKGIEILIGKTPKKLTFIEKPSDVDLKDSVIFTIDNKMYSVK